MKYFGTDGIRGIPGDTLPFNLVTKIGSALRALNNKKVLIATDTRISKDKMTDAIIEGITSAGMDAYLLGVLPTPALIYQSMIQEAVGVIITASHNPYQDNGIKIINKGYKLTTDEENSIENLINRSNESVNNGKIFNIDNALDDYLLFISKFIDTSDLSIAIDCANGATYQSAPYIFSKITDLLYITGIEPDGYNINRKVGSTNLNHISEVVLRNKCDIGFAYDGDGDRVLCVDNQGRKIDGDLIIYILARYLNSLNKLNKKTIVLTIMSNLGIIDELKKENISVIEANVGDKYVIERMNEDNLSLGGENSGHIILPDFFHTGDGLLTSIIVLNALKCLKLNISDVLDNIKLYNDKMVNIKVKDRQKVMDYEPLFIYKEEIVKVLNNDCKIIIRPSGTENLIRVSVMAKEREQVEYYSNKLVEIIESI